MSRNNRQNRLNYVKNQRLKKLCITGPHHNDRWPMQRCSACALDQKLNYQMKRAAHAS